VLLYDGWLVVYVGIYTDICSF